MLRIRARFTAGYRSCIELKLIASLSAPCPVVCSRMVPRPSASWMRTGAFLKEVCGDEIQIPWRSSV